MISVDDICNELQQIDIQVSDRINEIKHIGELAQESIGRVQAVFSDQRPGKTLINALSLIEASCKDASSSIGQVSVAVDDMISRIKR